MYRAIVITLAAGGIAAAVSAPAAAQNAGPAIAAASKAMGAEGVNSVKMWGSGRNYQLGQSNNANGPWPQSPLNDYVRAIDFTKPASRATAVTFGAAVTGGAATQGAFNQNITPTTAAWGQQLEVWITPWGFLKGAAANNATAAAKTVDGRRFTAVSWNAPVKAPSGQPYKVVGYIGPTNYVERVETWVENPIFGDMHVEAIYSDWRRGAGGFMWPSTIVQKRGGSATFDAQILGMAANPADIAALTTAPAGGPGGPPGGAGGPPGGAPAGPSSEQLAPGVWRIKSAYNSVAVEFADHVVLFEPGPQNEARAAAGIAEVKKVIPGKPIKYGVITHHHFDHTSGLPAVVGEGITIVTPEVNKAFLTKALSAPRTLAPDAIAKSGKKPLVEGFAGDKRVFSDASRTLEVHVIQGLPHADGLVVGWLPKEKILIYADMFNIPPAANPVPNPPVVGTQVFLANLERLKLEPERIVSIHSLNPDRLATMDDIRKSLGR